ncbi:MAG: hypothetical protein KatS3mg012_0872 [Gaiellaceae bacterium]|nr:MAG: hypothetical protein KatS3mg012_0872 [Gaiellaceae bacterium]
MTRRPKSPQAQTRLELSPDAGEGVLDALRFALERAGFDLDGSPAAYRSAWTSAGRIEATEPLEVYARSPRSTPGATRA